MNGMRLIEGDQRPGHRDSQQHGARARIAVVGSGISGLYAARKLSDIADLTIYEAGSHVGGHTNTIDVEADGQTLAIDTGFIVFNDLTYPLFSAMLRELGVGTQASEMSFSVRCDAENLEYCGSSLSRFFAQRSNLLRPRLYRLFRDVVRFGRIAPTAAETNEGDGTIDDFVNHHRFSDVFVRHYLVPIGASIWSCPPGRFRQFPLRFVVRFMANHRMLQIGGRPQWRVVGGGSARYVEKLIAPFADRIRLSCPVSRVRRGQGGVVVEAQGREERFDHVIIAAHADQALRMLASPTAVERDVLGCFRYQENLAILHCDERVLPRRRAAWAAWNYHVGRADGDQVVLTYNMNILQSLQSRRTWCVTLNDARGIDRARIVREIVYHHPVYSLGQERAHARHGELIDHDGISYCGAYWGNGFHEDGCRSADAVCQRLLPLLATRGSPA